MTEQLKKDRDRITTWFTANQDKLGTAEYRNAVLTHRLLTDLIARNGGSAEERAYVASKLAEMQTA